MSDRDSGRPPLRPARRRRRGRAPLPGRRARHVAHRSPRPRRARRRRGITRHRRPDRAAHVPPKTGPVQLAMPKWEQTLPPTDLFGWLCPLGFCAGAPFYGIAPGIFISAALHGAKAIVDEHGTEAAAATALAFRRSMPPPPRSHDRRRPPLPVGHRPPTHRRPAVRGPPSRPRRLAGSPPHRSNAGAAHVEDSGAASGLSRSGGW